LQHVPFPVDDVPEGKPLVEGILDGAEKAQLSFTGLAFSPDGSRIYLVEVKGDIKVFAVAKQIISRRCYPSHCPPLPKHLSGQTEIPAGIAVSARW